MKTGRKHHMPCLVAVAIVLTSSVYAAEEGLAERDVPGAAAGESDAQMVRLIRQLDADTFAERQEATARLGELGGAAIEALEGAALGDSLEVTVRSIELLQRQLESEDEASRESAKAALQRIAASDRPAAAHRARNALSPAPPPPVQNPMAQIAPGAIQIAVAANAGAQRITVRQINGTRTVEVEEPGQRVKLTEDPQQGIQVEVTSKKDGRETTEKFQAKNAEELRQKHPEAHKIYSKYANQGGNVRLQIQAGVPVPNLARPAAVREIDTAVRLLSAWGKNLKRLTSDDAIQQASRESQQALKKQVAEAREQLAELEQRLDQVLQQAEQKESVEFRDESAEDDIPQDQESP